MGSDPPGRSYGDPCGVARALDAVGERWALLVVRELLLGPKRFTDLQGGLGGISQNVLAQRLRELERAGVVVRRRLGPPARVWAYGLTERGASLEPVLIALGRWGRDLPLPDKGELSVDALLLALRTTFSPEAAGRLRLTAELRIDDDLVVVAVSGGQLSVTRGSGGGADIRVEADSGTLRALAFGRLTLAAALASGTLGLQGRMEHAERFFGLFAARGAPAAGSAGR